MSFGFCFALIPLLSLDMPAVFPVTGGAAFMRRIPLLELSTPEEYLQLIAPRPDEEEAVDPVDVEAPAVVKDNGSCDCCGSAGAEEDHDETGDGTAKTDEKVATEATPLLGDT
jgi:hypothetical protein